LENLDCLGFRFAKVLLKIINKKFYKTFELNDNDDNSIT
jgi:toxin secretion/phage lysis holin family protein